MLDDIDLKKENLDNNDENNVTSEFNIDNIGDSVEVISRSSLLRDKLSHRISSFFKKSLIVSIVAIVIIFFGSFYKYFKDDTVTLSAAIFSNIFISGLANLNSDEQLATFFEKANADQELLNKEKLVMLDPGYGGIVSGKVADGLFEKDINLSLAFHLRDYFEAQGYKVVMTRTDDSFVSIKDRQKMIEKVLPKLMIGIYQKNDDNQAIKLNVNSNYEEVIQENIFELVSNNLNNELPSKVSSDINSSLASNSSLKTPTLEVNLGSLSSSDNYNILSNVDQQKKISKAIADGVITGINKYNSGKIIYYTFDDGPSPKTTPIILDILKEKNVKATFFVMGKNVDAYPALAKRIVDEGHKIAIHTYSHNYSEIYTSKEMYINDFDKAFTAIQNATGVAPANVYRFPGGSMWKGKESLIKSIIVELGSRGFVHFDWNGSVEDAHNWANESTIFQHALSLKDKTPIVLLTHDTSKNTAASLPSILDIFADYDDRILSETVTPVQFIKAN